MHKKEEARNVIAALVERFEEQYDSYKRSDYSEALVRKDFIDPFFKALGWDMDNSQGYAEAYREVIHEDKVKVAKTLKAPDYSFKLSGGKRLFFVEAKKPFVKVKSEIEPAYQLRRYAWSAKLPISILTDFEEFSVYDCSKRPNVTDSAALGRIKYLTFREYVSEFDFLWEAFSKEHVLKGSFDKYVGSDKGKRGTATVDNAFLESLDTWRTYLATSIAKNNPKLTEDELNFTVQHAIDRIIFLRIAEDRGVEPYGQLSAAMKEGGDLYQNLFGLFQEADRKYNSGLFDFKKDRVSEHLVIDNKVVRTIVDELYYPKSPYEFSVLSVEILGSAYEQFLGKRIRMDSGHRARIEEKPEVRKAGGVYYTPQYIVDYIVQHTVGELVKGKAPKEVAELRIVDPACGSGSFLLGAFQFLLDWHRNYYSAQAKPNRGKKDDVLRPDGQLTTGEKKRILLNNIYGVDLDANAVEVTKLSLLLKCMEGETEASIKQQLGMFHDRVLPTLDENIKCGNSLIDTDGFDLFPDDEVRRVRPFNWPKAFPPVFKNGGFDAVIGNPPYVRSQFLDEVSKSYFAEHYPPVRYQPDTFALFMVRGIDLLNDGGRLGFIIPNGILTNTYYASLRKHMLTSTAMQVVVDLKDGVFESASVDTSIFILRRTQKGPPTGHKVRIGECRAKDYGRVSTPDNAVDQKKMLAQVGQVFNTSASEAAMGLLDRIRKAGQTLDTVVVVKNGMKVRKELLATTRKDERYKRFIVGGHIDRYAIRPTDRWVCYDRRLEAKYTNQAFRDEAIFTAEEKLLVRQVYGKEGIHCAVDRTKLYCDQTCYVLLPRRDGGVLDFMAGVLSSRLIRFYFERTMSDRKATFPKIKGDQLKQLPIVVPEKRLRYEVVGHVEAIAKLKADAASAKLPHLVEQIQQRIAHTEERLNAAVYEIYGLSKQDMEMVEAGVKGNEG